MKSCNQDISKSITAMSLKHSQQIISRQADENLKKSYFFFELLPFENLDIESLVSQKYYSLELQT